MADHFRDGRVLVAGDAAHVWLPLGGFGMSTGIGDAVGGWGGPRLLAGYESERRSVGEAISHAALKIESDMKEITSAPSFHEDSDEGHSLGHAAGQLIQKLDRQQWYSHGVQFGARYESSPGVIDWPGADRTRAIERIDEYLPSVRPGGRFPHAWLIGRRSVFDPTSAWPWTFPWSGRTSRTPTPSSNTCSSTAVIMSQPGWSPLRP